MNWRSFLLASHHDNCLNPFRCIQTVACIRDFVMECGNVNSPHAVDALVKHFHKHSAVKNSVSEYFLLFIYICAIGDFGSYPDH